jgi:hypothetical protein
LLERLTFEDFVPLVGEVFTITENGLRLELELQETRPQNPDAPAADAAGKRAPFSLMFRGPADPVLPQRIYRLDHDALGPLEIFLVPVGRDEAGTGYQAVFG